MPYFWKSSKIWKCCLLQIIGGALWVKWHHHDMSRLSIFMNFWEPFLNMKMQYLMVNKKKNPLFVWVWDRKICPLRSLLSSLSKPLDAKQWSSGRIFLSHPHTHDGFLYARLFRSCTFHCGQARNYYSCINLYTQERLIFKFFRSSFCL